MRLLIRFLGLVTVPMTRLPPQHTIASQTVVSSSLNGFQQGSSDASLRTFRNGRGHMVESHQIGPHFVLPYVGQGVMCLLHVQQFPRPCNYLPTRGKRGRPASLSVWLERQWPRLIRGNPEITVHLG